jgi:hypothetical protein
MSQGTADAKSRNNNNNNWHQEETQKLDRETRKMLTTYRQHHRRADIDHLYVPRKEGGRGLMQVEGAYIAEILNLEEYVESKEDPLIQIVRTHQHNTNSALLTANKFKKSFLFLNALLTLKVENSLIFLAGTRIPTVYMMKWELILPLKK